MVTDRILVVGSGGREHALAWRLGRDPDPAEVVVAPGNAGIGRAFRRLAVDELDAAALTRVCRAEGVTLAVIGPEAPLALGVSDALTEAGILVFGPSRAAARIESSKWFAKQLMIEAGVPTARAELLEDLPAARAALDRFDPPWVIKADGLAAGKGVRVAREREAAEVFLAECLETDRFGRSGRRVLIEEHLEGEEASVIAVSDGKDFILLPAARDYKRAYDRDLGGNTGGMGAFAPAERVDEALQEQIGSRVVRPALAALERRGTPYRGALYCGMVIHGESFHVLEFNCRFGDPETQVVLPLVEGNLRRLLESAAGGTLDATSIARGGGATVGIALVDEGYPDQVRGGGSIEGLEDLMSGDQVLVFHGGSNLEDGAWKVRGGRAATVVARAETRPAARDRAYAAIGRLKGSGWRCRHDIAAGPAPEWAGGGELAGRFRGLA